MKILISLFLIFNFYTVNESVTIELVGFSNDKGKAYVRVRNSKDNIISQKVLAIKNNKASFSLDPAGASSLAVDAFHDENGNGKLDKNVFGAPTEAWGVSSDNRPMFRAPTLEEILVPVKNGSVITVKLK
jgi:uncharacterized protein (DUF2141 family)